MDDGEDPDRRARNIDRETASSGWWFIEFS
jgi:hypothetical protein